MPIYEYRCQSCGEDLEVLQRVSDPVLTECPSCGDAALKKRVSAVGFQLKGTGWYVTDFRDKGKAPSKKAEDKDGGESKGAEKTEAKAESKSESKTEPASSNKGSDSAGASAT